MAWTSQAIWDQIGLYVRGANTIQCDSSIRWGVQLYTPAASGTATIDFSLGNYAVVQMPAGNITIAVVNQLPGVAVWIRIIQDSVGSRTVSWPTAPAIKWAGGSAPTLTTGASKSDIVEFMADANGNLYDIGLRQNE